MKKSSTFQLILLVVFGAVGVAGVLIFALAVGGGSSNTTGSVRIWGQLDGTAFTSVIRKLAEEDNELMQTTYEQKDPSSYESDITNALANGEGPDLFVIRSDYAIKNSGKAMLIPYASLAASQYQSVYASAANPYLLPNGIVALPLLIDPLVMYWNRDMLAAAGFSKPPQVWADISTSHMAEKITKRDSAGIIKKSLIAFGEYQNVPNAKEILSLLILQAGGQITTRDSTGNLTPALSTKNNANTTLSLATESALRFYTEFADPSKANYSWNRAQPDARTAFAAGDVALYIGFASEAPLITRMNPNTNFAIAPIPQIDNERAIDIGRAYALAVSRTSRNQSGAINVAYRLASASSTTAFSAAFGMPSARNDVLNIPQKGVDEVFRRSAIISRAWIDPDSEKTAEVFRAMIEDTVSGAQIPSAAISRADQAIAQLLGI